MLNQDTKRKIDSCRDILVGKVPDPQAQRLSRKSLLKSKPNKR